MCSSAQEFAACSIFCAVVVVFMVVLLVFSARLACR
jgi:hypothetical protein